MDRVSRFFGNLPGLGGGAAPADAPLVDTAEKVQISSLALLKMLMLAFKEESAPLQSFLEEIDLIPVSISYELDPCAVMKARELRLIDDSGSYEKAEDEDLNSMIEGLLGYKGRVHLEFGQIDRHKVDSLEKLRTALDQAIVGGLRVFETNKFADNFLKGEVNSMSFDCEKQLKELNISLKSKK